ncbi:glyoxal oxidase precursor [Sistotremastrum niveocremeum HHB9708]|uniref:Glyoxal oxidase n=1 Tax=Sistotremastrum niveocremeum HHB9708 TaxID=1314777 RepID=A0A164Z402_9AGAM|nr:glyoxal oxidase precursor [Sistotremastrum niveocremeum HHB9708]
MGHSRVTVVLWMSRFLSFFFLIPLASAVTHEIPAQWTLVQNGTTGVAAMQLSVVSPTLAIIFDKVEHNPLQIGNHSAWAALYNLETNVVTPLNLTSNSFCAGGTFLSNGTLLNVGGNGVVSPEDEDQNGFQGLRIFEPCTDPAGAGCTVFDDPITVRLVKPRWYPSAIRIWDGSAMVIGGTAAGGFLNTAGSNEPSYEFFPPKNNSIPIVSPFLQDTLGANLFPLTFALPDGTVFIAANNQSMIYNIANNTETRFPPFPNNVRVTYPMTGTGVLLPLTPPNYTPEILICGGSNASDQVLPSTLSSQTPASSQCVRMVLDEAGIAGGWIVEQLPVPRIMPDSIILPTGQIMFVNGGATGVAGYGNVPDQIGQSNADNPVFTPVIYDPSAPAGSRFNSTGLPASTIARLYHSTASFTPMGNVMISGSNPNLDVQTRKYATEYRVEWFNPPFFDLIRPNLSGLPKNILFGQNVNVTVSIPAGLDLSTLQVALMDLGFATHATHSTSRLVYLSTVLSGNTLQITGPPNAGIYPPGPGYIYLVVGGVWGAGTQIIVGTGGAPPVSS